jgi:hypothetical protein
LSTADISAGTVTEVPGTSSVDLRLEVVLLGLSDVDRAKVFDESLDWRLDADVAGDDGYRCVPFNAPDGNRWVLQELTTPPSRTMT